MRMLLRRLSFVFSIWMTLFGSAAVAVETSSPLYMSLVVPELVLVDFPNGGSTHIDLQITGDCATNSGVCMLGVATIDFILYGNSKVVVRDPRQVSVAGSTTAVLVSLPMTLILKRMSRHYTMMYASKWCSSAQERPRLRCPMWTHLI